MSDEASSGYTSTTQETSESDSEEISSSNSSSAGTRFYSSDSGLEDGEANKARAGKELTLGTVPVSFLGSGPESVRLASDFQLSKGVMSLGGAMKWCGKQDFVHFLLRNYSSWSGLHSFLADATVTWSLMSDCPCLIPCRGGC